MAFIHELRDSCSYMVDQERDAELYMKGFFPEVGGILELVVKGAKCTLYCDRKAIRRADLRYDDYWHIKNYTTRHRDGPSKEEIKILVTEALAAYGHLSRPENSALVKVTFEEKIWGTGL